MDGRSYSAAIAMDRVISQGRAATDTAIGGESHV
jgi:hypothetical protein